MNADLVARCEIAYRRRFGHLGACADLRTERTGESTARVSDLARGGWVDFNLRNWRVRAIAWNAPRSEAPLPPAPPE